MKSNKKVNSSEVIDALRKTGKVTADRIKIEKPPNLRGKDIREIRKNWKLSQAAFARLLNVSVKTIQAWEYQNSKPKGYTLRLIQIFKDFPSVRDRYLTI